MKTLLKLATLFTLGLSAGWLSAQSVYVYPAAVSAPRGSYQTCTAIVTGVNNKTVTWSTTGGTLVGINPSTANEPATIALTSTTAGTYTVTATSGAVTGTCVITLTASPTPVTTNPRFMVNSSLLAGLQAKFGPSNVAAQAITNIATAAYTNDNAIWSWTCNAGTGQPSSPQLDANLIGHAWLFAQMATFYPTDPSHNWKCYGHDVFLYVAAHLAAGDMDPSGNTWSDQVLAFGLTPDWLIGAGGLTTTGEKNTARSYLAWWAIKVLRDLNVGGVAPVTGYNSTTQFDQLGNIRSMGNNYTMTRLFYMMAVGYTFNDDTTNDPPLTNTCSATRYQVCPDFTAGSLHAYGSYLMGAYLLRMYGHLEDPGVSKAALSMAYPSGGFSGAVTCPYLGSSYGCLGDGRGGESSEGSWYQYAMERLAWMVNAMHTAGIDDPMIYGPQVSLEHSSWWDMKVNSDLSFLNSFGYDGNTSSPGYGFLTTGDTYHTSRWPADFGAISGLLTNDWYTGRSDRTAKLMWLVTNMAFGGPLGTSGGCTSYCGFNPELSNDFASPLALDIFMAAPNDPTASLASDPRPSLPTDLYNASFNQHLMARTGWASTDTLFSYYAPSTLIDHEHQFAGRFDVFANGEYLTHGRTEFNDYNMVQTQASNQNVLGLINATSGNLGACGTGTVFGPLQVAGGQWWHGEQNIILPTLKHSELPAYVATSIDSTGVYNSSSLGDCPGANDVTAASRSLVYIRAQDRVVYYDRGNTGTARNKATYLIATNTPSFASNTVTWLSKGGSQKAAWTALLPAATNPTLDQTFTSANDYYVPGGVQCVANNWCEADVKARVKIDAGSTTSARFLSTFEWGPSSLVPVGGTSNPSSAGQGFDCAFTSSETTMVCFMRTVATFTGTTYHALGATSHYVADLTPGTTYTISASGGPASATTDTAGVLAFTSDGTGDVSVSTGGTPTASAPTFSPVAGSYVGAQAVTVTSTSFGAIKCYNFTGSPATNGTTGCAVGSTLYSGPVTVSSTSTLYARAGGTGWLDSPIGSAAYTFTLPAATTPTCAPAAGTYFSTQSVTCSSTTPASTTYCTIDGSTPTTSSPPCVAISVSSTLNLKAISAASGFTNSAILTQGYTITPPVSSVPTFTGAATITGTVTIQ